MLCISMLHTCILKYAYINIQIHTHAYWNRNTSMFKYTHVYWNRNTSTFKYTHTSIEIGILNIPNTYFQKKIRIEIRIFFENVVYFNVAYMYIEIRIHQHSNTHTYIEIGILNIWSTYFQKKISTEIRYFFSQCCVFQCCIHAYWNTHTSTSKYTHV